MILVFLLALITSLIFPSIIWLITRKEKLKEPVIPFIIPSVYVILNHMYVFMVNEISSPVDAGRAFGSILSNLIISFILALVMTKATKSGRLYFSIAFVIFSLIIFLIRTLI